MNIVINPGNSLHGEFTLPGDKSLSHRAALFAAMAQGESRINNFLCAGVTEVMLKALGDLGITINLTGNTLIVGSTGITNFQESTHAIHCGNSATTLRLLAGALTTANIPAILDGTEGLRQRPMDRIVEPLLKMGVKIKSTHGYAPLRLEKRQKPISGIFYHMPVASAQVKSCLLLAGLAADSPTTIWEKIPSRDHTERMLKSMGVNIETTMIDKYGQMIYQTKIEPSLEVSLDPLNITLPGDISAASFLIVAGLIVPGSMLKLKGVGLNPSRLGLLESLIKMGANIQIVETDQQAGEPVGDLIVLYSQLSATQVEGSMVVKMIDEFPIFAIAAASAQGLTIVRDAQELRYKESDRISAICTGLSKMGVSVVEREDGFEIQGNGRIRGGNIQDYNDHRLAMAMVIAGLVAENSVSIEGAEVFEESFPDFILVLQRAGANIHVGSN